MAAAPPVAAMQELPGYDDAERLKQWTDKIDAWRRVKGAYMTSGRFQHDESKLGAMCAYTTLNS